jgi:hypothetical protein
MVQSDGSVPQSAGDLKHMVGSGQNEMVLEVVVVAGALE